MTLHRYAGVKPSGEPLLFVALIVIAYILARLAFYADPLDPVALDSRAGRAPWAGPAPTSPVVPIGAIARTNERGGAMTETGVEFASVQANPYRPNAEISAGPPVGGSSSVQDDALFQRMRLAEMSGRWRIVANSLARTPTLLTSPPVSTAGVTGKTGPVLEGVGPPARPGAARWSAAAWALLRPRGDEAPTANTLLPRYGATQIGGEIAWRPREGERLDLYSRITAAPGPDQGVEAAAGVRGKPLRDLPLSIAVERRFRVTGSGRNAFALIASGGIGPIGDDRPLSLEAYGQVGVVGLASRDVFADGQTMVSRRVVGRGQSNLRIGVGSWGGLQPGVRRLDIGPSVTAGFPVADGRGRLSVEWRQRVAGNAQPGSGPALALAASF